MINKIQTIYCRWLWKRCERNSDFILYEGTGTGTGSRSKSTTSGLHLVKHRFPAAFHLYVSRRQVKVKLFH